MKGEQKAKMLNSDATLKAEGKNAYM